MHDINTNLTRKELTETLANQLGYSQSNCALIVDSFLDGKWDADRGTWGEHVGSWLGARRSYDSLLVLRYEDLHA